jgi:hypothetical protein
MPSSPWDRLTVHDRLLPPLRGQGPQGPRRPPTHFFDIDETFYDFLIALLEMDNIVETFEEQIRRHVKGLALSWTRFTNTLQHFAQNVELADATFFGFDLAQLTSIVAVLRRGNLWQDRALRVTDCLL